MAPPNQRLSELHSRRVGATHELLEVLRDIITALHGADKPVDRDSRAIVPTSVLLALCCAKVKRGRGMEGRRVAANWGELPGTLGNKKMEGGRWEG